MHERTVDVGRGITLCYETFGDPADPPLLLVMGLGMQMLGWDEGFCERLAAEGFRVVRFDNRDTGRSTHLGDVRPPTVGQLVKRGGFDERQYSLSDMALDTAELLRRLGLAPAHVVGASMGGMIAQTLAAEHPDAVRSLTSIMSSTGHRLQGQPRLAMYRFLLKRAPTDREGYLDHTERVFTAIGSPGFPTDTARLRERAGRAFDRGTDPAGTGRQLAAILQAGNRTAQLRTIRVPTLVIHGTKDKLVTPTGGRATARAIPEAKLLRIEGMGHDLPEGAWPQIVGAIAQHARSIDAASLPSAAAAA